MYLRRLYKTSRWWFVIIALFIIIQLAMDVRQDIMLSPVYHYGMYSEVMMPQPEYTVNEITAGGRLLRPKDFTPYEWDRIILPVKYWQNQQSWNSFVWNTEIKRLLKLTDSTKYTNSLNDEGFCNWYKGYISKALHMQVKSVTVQKVTYIFKDGVPVKKATE